LVERDIGELVRGMLEGEEVSLARLISTIEDDLSTIPEVLERIPSNKDESYRIGITGAPSVGKSALVDQLIILFRNDGLSVGVIAVDPSSSISGGALLGDRVRMQRHWLDRGVFIRSMATRCSSGGLSRAASTAVRLLSAFGKDIIIVETAGVGQTEVDVKNIVNSVVVVLNSEYGDSIQLMKAGLIEIADIIVVNKADRGGADRLATEIQAVLSLSGIPKDQVPVLTSEAINSKGIEELYQAIRRYMP